MNSRDRDTQLNSCVLQYYGQATGIPFTPGGITVNMTNYHAFHESGGHPGIALTTPAVILELGVLSYDRDLLQNHTDEMARGVFDSLLCFLEPTALATLLPSTPPNGGSTVPTATPVIASGAPATP